MKPSTQGVVDKACRCKLCAQSSLTCFTYQLSSATLRSGAKAYRPSCRDSCIAKQRNCSIRL
jgi:hypothetical protein